MNVIQRAMHSFDYLPREAWIPLIAACAILGVAQSTAHVRRKSGEWKVVKRDGRWFMQKLEIQRVIGTIMPSEQAEEPAAV